MYDFENPDDASTVNFFGSNEGLPMELPVSSAMLDGKKHFLQTACPEVNRAVPYFERPPVSLFNTMMIAGRRDA